MLQNCDKKMHFRFNFDACPVHSPFGFVHSTHQNFSAHALFCDNSLTKVNTQLLIYKYWLTYPNWCICWYSFSQILKGELNMIAPDVEIDDGKGKHWTLFMLYQFVIKARLGWLSVTTTLTSKYLCQVWSGDIDVCRITLNHAGLQSHLNLTFPTAWIVSINVFQYFSPDTIFLGGGGYWH